VLEKKEEGRRRRWCMASYQHSFKMRCCLVPSLLTQRGDDHKHSRDAQQQVLLHGLSPSSSSFMCPGRSVFSQERPPAHGTTPGATSAPAPGATSAPAWCHVAPTRPPWRPCGPAEYALPQLPQLWSTRASLLLKNRKSPGAILLHSTLPSLFLRGIPSPGFLGPSVSITFPFIPSQDCGPSSFPEASCGSQKLPGRPRPAWARILSHGLPAPLL